MQSFRKSMHMRQVDSIVVLPTQAVLIEADDPLRVMTKVPLSLLGIAS